MPRNSARNTIPFFVLSSNTRQLQGEEYEEKGYGLPRMNKVCAEAGLNTAVRHPFDPSKEAHTIWECFTTGVEIDPSHPFMHTRTYRVDPNYVPPHESQPEAKENKDEEKNAEAAASPVEAPVEAPAAVATELASAAAEQENKEEAKKAEAKTDEGKESKIEETKESKDAKPAEVKPAGKKPRVPSGYIEREDGSIKRFDYVHDTYGEAYDSAIALGRGLVSIGNKRGDAIGIFGVNRAEWIISALAVYSQTMRVVPLYATLGKTAVEYIIQHAAVGTLIVTKENLQSIKNVIGNVKDTLKRVILIDCIHQGRYGNTLDKVKQADSDFFAQHGVQLLSLNSLIEDNRKNDSIPINPPKPEDVAFIMYTSGTTGLPKGVIMTHRNVVSVAGSIKYLLTLNIQDTYFSYLPLAHIFETAAQSVVWTFAGQVYFSQGDTRQLVDDLRTAKPKIMCGVPRIFSRIYSNIMNQVSKKMFLKRWYFNRALSYQIGQLRKNEELDASYDARVFAPIRDLVGLTNVKIILSGAAPCPPYLIEFMRVLLGPGAIFLQGYGMTECCAGACVTLANDRKCGNVGPPLASNWIKLGDIPELGYMSTDEHPRGEVCIHGPAVFSGYFKNPEATAEAFHTDPQGRLWLHTGDVGRWNPDGSLSIIDRKKNILKLQQGEYVAIEVVEDTYGRTPCVSQIWCYGNSYKTMLVAVVVVDPVQLYDYAVSKKYWNPETLPAPRPGAITPEFIKAYHDLIVGEKGEEIKAWVASELKAHEGSLQGFEKVKAIYLEPNIDAMGQGFTEENECLTPTMKKKRTNLVERYLPVLKNLYTSLNEPPQEGERW